MNNKPAVGIIGAGRLGTALARALSSVGYDVAIINSRGTDSLTLQLSVMLPGVVAKELPDLIAGADIVILAVPLPRYRDLPPNLLGGKIVIDAMNYWSPVDGHLPEFDAYIGSSSELVAKSLPGARIVKTFNSVAYGEIEEQSQLVGSPKRRAIPLAGDDEAAKGIVMKLIDSVGFDAVDCGPLAHGAWFQPDTNLFNRRLTKAEIEDLIPQR